MKDGLILSSFMRFEKTWTFGYGLSWLEDEIRPDLEYDPNPSKSGFKNKI